jgi:hypothetical protein
MHIHIMQVKFLLYKIYYIKKKALYLKHDLIMLMHVSIKS